MTEYKTGRCRPSDGDHAVKLTPKVRQFELATSVCAKQVPVCGDGRGILPWRLIPTSCGQCCDALRLRAP